MKTSPLDLRHQRFRIAFRGFDQVEVTALLAAAADDYEEALHEADRLRQEVVRIEAMLSEHREHEKNLRDTLITAQRLSDEIKEHAAEEARRIVREAVGHAEILTERTQLRVDDLHRDIDGLMLKRREAETSVEATIQTLRNTLDYVRESGRRDERALLHRPQEPAETASGDSPKLAIIR